MNSIQYVLEFKFIAMCACLMVKFIKLIIIIFTKFILLLFGEVKVDVAVFVECVFVHVRVCDVECIG